MASSDDDEGAETEVNESGDEEVDTSDDDYLPPDKIRKLNRILRVERKRPKTVSWCVEEHAETNLRLRRTGQYAVQDEVPDLSENETDPLENAEIQVQAPNLSVESTMGCTNNENNVEHEDTEESIFTGNPFLKYPTKYTLANGRSYVQRTYKCWSCSSVQCNREGYKRHKSKHFEKSNFECTQCTYSCSNSWLLRKHSACHTPQYFDTSKKKRKRKRQSPYRKTRRVFNRDSTGNAGSASTTGSQRTQYSAQAQNGVRRRLDPVKHGVITQEEMSRIKKGNPEFNYATHRTTFDGQLYWTPFRCWFCARSFQGFSHWQAHQAAHGNRVTQYKCPHKNCVYKTFGKEHFDWHCAAGVHNFGCNANASLAMEAPQLEIQKSSPTQDSTNNSRLVNEQVINVLAELNVPTTPSQERHLGRCLKPETESQEYLISSITICNIMGITTKNMQPAANLYCAIGALASGKTSQIIACLVGLGYDILLDLHENSTLCGVNLSNILRHGQTSGYVEVTLNLSPFKELKKKYGNQLKLRRQIQKDIPLAESTFRIWYGHIYEQLSKSQVKQILNILMPSFLLRIMVFSPENVLYLAENFQVCNEIFCKLVEIKKADLEVAQKLITFQIAEYKKDLDSRESRMLFLNESRLQDHSNIPMLQELQTAHATELNIATVRYRNAHNALQELIQEEADLRTQITNQLVEMVDKMRISFQKFLQSQNYVGDLIVNTVESAHELIVWLKDVSPFQSVPRTTEEARQVWQCLTLARRKLAAKGLFLAFSLVLDCCPIMLGDVFSSSELEFQLSENALRILIDTAHQESSRQFIFSVPRKNLEE